MSAELKNEARPKRKIAFWDRCKSKLKAYYVRFRRLKGDPREIAGGLALGVFIALTPTIPAQSVLGIGLAYLLRVSKLAAFLALWVNNPVTIPFIYIVDYQIGQFILGEPGVRGMALGFSVSHLVNLGWKVGLPLLVGGVILGIGTAVPVYFVSKRLYIGYRRQRKARLKRKRARVQAAKATQRI
jgi:uncharacterized protein